MLVIYYLLLFVLVYYLHSLHKLSQMYYEKMSLANIKLLELFLRVAQI